MTPRVLVLGTGALGCTFAARLARAHVASVAVAGRWAAALDAVATRGIAVDDGVSCWQVPVAARTLTQVDEDAADLVLVLVKSHQTASVARIAARAAGSAGLVLTLQNGMGNREILTAAGCRAAAGVTTVGATLVGTAFVRCFAGETVLGGPPSLQRWADVFTAAGLPCRVEADADVLLWRKLAVNCAINGWTARLGLTNGALVARDDLRPVVLATAREVAAVAAARGHHLGDVESMVLDVARRTASNRSSMLQDVARGAPTEVDALCGFVAREGRATGVPTPWNAALLAAVQTIQQAAG